MSLVAGGPGAGRVAVAVAGIVGVAGAGAAVLLLGLAVRRVEVTGRSMVPTLWPGDRVMVVRVPAWWPLRPGSLVAVSDPRSPGRLLVKRAEPAARRRVRLFGDNPAESTDSRTFGLVPRRSVIGVACYRYAPPERAGRVLGTGQHGPPVAPRTVPVESGQVSGPEGGARGGTLCDDGVCRRRPME